MPTIKTCQFNCREAEATVIISRQIFIDISGIGDERQYRQADYACAYWEDCAHRTTPHCPVRLLNQQ